MQSYTTKGIRLQSNFQYLPTTIYHVIDYNNIDWTVFNWIYHAGAGADVKMTSVGVDNLTWNDLRTKWFKNLSATEPTIGVQPSSGLFDFFSGQAGLENISGTATYRKKASNLPHIFVSKDNYIGPLWPFNDTWAVYQNQAKLAVIFPSEFYPGKWQWIVSTNSSWDSADAAARITAGEKDVIFGGPLGEATLGIELAFLGGALSSSAPASGGTDIGAVANASATGTSVESAIPTYIAAPAPVSSIPEYIAASTPAAALPVDVALGTDASILGLTGGAAAETSSIYGSVENLISQGKDLVAQYKPVISDITKLKTVYDIASGKQPTKPTPVKSTTQASGAAPRGSSGASGLIPIGIILGLLLLT